MGVHGLTSYIEENKDLFFKDHKLHDCVVLLDGNSVASQIYSYSKSNYAFGGDYDKFTYNVNEFISLLLKCKITPIFVFDGAYEERKLKTIVERINVNVRICSQYKNKYKESKCFPLLLKDVFKGVLIKHNLYIVQSDFEADQELIIMSKQFQWSIISYDSDFFLADVDYVPFNTLNLTPLKLRSSRKEKKYYISCKMFVIDNLLLKFGGLTNKTLLPLLSAVLGNDYIPGNTFEGFLSLSHNLPFPKKLEKIIKWLQSVHVVEDGIKQMVSVVDERRRKRIRNLLLTMVEDNKSYSNLIIYMSKQMLSGFRGANDHRLLNVSTINNSSSGSGEHSDNCSQSKSKTNRAGNNNNNNNKIGKYDYSDNEGKIIPSGAVDFVSTICKSISSLYIGEKMAAEKREQQPPISAADVIMDGIGAAVEDDDRNSELTVNYDDYNENSQDVITVSDCEFNEVDDDNNKYLLKSNSDTDTAAEDDDLDYIDEEPSKIKKKAISTTGGISSSTSSSGGSSVAAIAAVLTAEEPKEPPILSITGCSDDRGSIDDGGAANKTNKKNKKKKKKSKSKQNNDNENINDDDSDHDDDSKNANDNGGNSRETLFTNYLINRRHRYHLYANFVPEWLRAKLIRGVISPSIMNILCSRRLFINSQAEDYTASPSHEIALPILKVIIGLLMKSSASDSLKDDKNDSTSSSSSNNKVPKYVKCHARVRSSFAATSDILPLCSTLAGTTLPLLDDIPSLDVRFRMAILLDTAGIENYLELRDDFPDDWMLFVVAVVYWARNCRYPEINRFHVRAIVVCALYLYVIDERIGYVRVRKTLTKAYDDDDIAKQQSSITTATTITANNDVVTAKKKIDGSFSSSIDMIKSADKIDCYQVANALLDYHKVEDSLLQNRTCFDIKLVHSFAQLQSCLHYFMMLNTILDFPLVACQPAKFLSGTFLYNFYSDINNRRNDEYVTRTLFSKAPTINSLYKRLVSKLDSIIFFDHQSKMAVSSTYEANNNNNNGINVAGGNGIHQQKHKKKRNNNQRKKKRNASVADSSKENGDNNNNDSVGDEDDEDRSYYDPNNKFSLLMNDGMA